MSNEEEFEGLRGNDFENYFRKVDIVFPLFLSVVAINDIPLIFPPRHFVICNLSERHLKGSHWMVILRISETEFEIFNSLGQTDLNYIKPYFNFDIELNIDFNVNSVQSESSKNCGYFCIYFIVFRILNLDMALQTILEDIFYTNDLIKNDKIVTQFCNNILTSTNDDFFCFHDF